MTKKSKKLGVKISKSEVFDDSSFEVTDKNEDTESQSSSSSNKEDVTTGSNSTLDQICSTLDHLTIDLLILMQQQMQHKINIEKSMTDGELHLSKSRYIMGHKNVSTLQLPNENSPDVSPSVLVEEINDDVSLLGKPRLKLLTEDCSTSGHKDEEDGKNVPDPVKWFGVLVPRDLRAAQTKFKNALSSVVDCANTQIRLHQTCVQIKKLTELKNKLRQESEK